MQQKFKITNSLLALFILVGYIMFSSCNSSLNILNRKYRPGYTINFSSKVDDKSDLLKKEEKIQVEAESLTEQNNEENNIVASSNSSELFINRYKSVDYIIPCDTPPRKSIEEPWSLYKPKETLEEGNSKWKPIEPFNLASFFIILLGLIGGALISPGVWLFFLLYSVIFIFSIISLIRIKNHPKKYSKFSKVFDWIFVSLGIALISIFLIVLVIILA